MNPSSNDVPDESIIGTMQINAKQYGAIKHPIDRFQSGKYALAGLLYLFRRESSIQLLSVFSFVGITIAFYLQIDLIAFILFFISLGMVWITEAVNTAIEAVVDLASPQIHPLAKVAKDVASAATVISIFISSVVTLLLLVPPLLERLF
jgi:diacylglycerol kinase